MTYPMSKDEVFMRLRFAEKRLQELLSLNGGDLPGADASERQQLIMEFFFHLVGATEELAQVVNQIRGLSINPEDVGIQKVSKNLPPADPAQSKLKSLYANVRACPLPANPYTDEAYIYRVRNYRNQVSHRGSNPFLFRVGIGVVVSPAASLLLDPRRSDLGPSEKAAQDELQYMLKLIKNRCEEILALL